MEWTRNRETTEEEHIIYCLLGILGISMLTPYGEGKEKASRRLHMEIEVEAGSRAPSIIPFSRNDHFVGQGSQLAELEAKLFEDKNITTLVIVGPGGTGKSQLALELAYKTRENKTNCSIFWVDASDLDSLYQSYARIAQKLNIPGWDDENIDIKQLVKLHLSKKGARQCLLMLDNITLESNELSAARTANLVDYLPRSELCYIVFTTTHSDTAKCLASGYIMELHEMAPDTALRMLENHLNAPVLSEQQEAKLMLKELSYLPLAIVQAAAYINTENITLQKYRSQLAKQKKASLGYDTQGPVATTLLIFMDQIHHSNALAVDYLFLAACVNRKDITLDFLEASSPREKEDAIKVLSRYALVARRPAESALDLHQLVHRALREWLRKQARLDQCTRVAIKQLLRVFPDRDHGNRSKWRRLLPHAKYVLSHGVLNKRTRAGWT